jgi:hypothetical protein
MPNPMPTICPVCGDELRAARLHCAACGTSLSGDFTIDPLARLSAAQKQFAVSFLKCRGNIRAMEKLYAISYPTVRARLDEVCAALGLETDSADFGGADFAGSEEGYLETGSGQASAYNGHAAGERRAILERLARGELDAETARDLLGKD